MLSLVFLLTAGQASAHVVSHLAPWGAEVGRRLPRVLHSDQRGLTHPLCQPQHSTGEFRQLFCIVCYRGSNFHLRWFAEFYGLHNMNSYNSTFFGMVVQRERLISEEFYTDRELSYYVLKPLIELIMWCLCELYPLPIQSSWIVPGNLRVSLLLI